MFAKHYSSARVPLFLPEIVLYVYTHRSVAQLAEHSLRAVGLRTRTLVNLLVETAIDEMEEGREIARKSERSVVRIHPPRMFPCGNIDVQKNNIIFTIEYLVLVVQRCGHT